MTDRPTDRRYSREHEWVLTDGGTALVGITDYAQAELGDVVFLNLPEVGAQVTQYGKLGEVESVKAVSDLFSPVSGEVVEVHQELMEHPEWVNEDPFGKAWMVRVRMSDRADLAKLMTAEQYAKFLEGLEH
ncbi:MAG: glycine cleavage system protein GcvH [Dehalococcoidia bacterium]|nr:glycine cleavage system protein GcvH [Dehalococcoidia bacterium]